VNAARWFYGQPGFHAPSPADPGAQVARLTAAACSVCHQDRPLTKGVCEHCAPQPVVDPRWLVEYQDGSEQRASYISKADTLRVILQMHPTARVTDLRAVACDACQGSCTGQCDAGAGTWPERQVEERTGRTVSEQRLPPIEDDIVFQSKFGHIGRLGGVR
jgi:hypothetical protein